MLIIWAIWFSEILFILIILLNFPIAIISQSYEGVMSTAIANKSLHQAELNQEFVRISPQGGQISLFLVASDITKDSEDNFMGIITGVKRYMSHEMAQSRKEMQKVRRDLEASIDAKIDAKFNRLAEIITQEVKGVKEMIKSN